MIFLGDLKEVGENKCLVGLVHNFPLHPTHGFNKTIVELKQEGVLIESIPKPEITEGKTATLFVNPETKEVWYEYEDLPLTPKDELNQLKQDNTLLKMAIIEQDIQTSDEITALKLAVLELDMALENLKGAN